MKRMHLPVAVLIVAVLFLAACGGAVDTSASSPEKQEIAQVQDDVALKRFELEQLIREKKSSGSSVRSQVEGIAMIQARAAHLRMNWT